jgi:hypothetical protein
MDIGRNSRAALVIVGRTTAEAETHRGALSYRTIAPPSTTMISPVTHDERSLAR